MTDTEFLEFVRGRQIFERASYSDFRQEDDFYVPVGCK
jgi:hypothetical protein